MRGIAEQRDAAVGPVEDRVAVAEYPQFPVIAVLDNLLRTRVDVERQTQNQELLSSMNRRADVQLQLQRTVEGLSVVAISYYATGLSLYVLTPLSGVMGMSKSVLTAAVVPLVVGSVYLALRRIRKHIPH